AGFFCEAQHKETSVFKISGLLSVEKLTVFMLVMWPVYKNQCAIVAVGEIRAHIEFLEVGLHSIGVPQGVALQGSQPCLLQSAATGAFQLFPLFRWSIAIRT